MWTRTVTVIAVVAWLGGGCSTDKSGLGDGGGPDAPADRFAGSGGGPGSGGRASGGSNGSGGAPASGGAVGSGGNASGGALGSGGRSGTGGTPATGGASASGGASSTGGASASGGRSGSGGVSSTGGRMGTGGRGGDGGGGAGGSTRCAGLAGLTCPAEQYCEFMPGFCKYPDAAGTCATRPTGCTLEYAPVCGCDGKVYSNDCARRSAGVSKVKDGMCNPEGCPAIPPTAGATCPAASLACTYTDVNDPYCFRVFTCGAAMTWGPPATACAAL